ncbi:MAG: hypothetical protein ABI480_15260 [Chitinophagaceae bacterium]
MKIQQMNLAVVKHSFIISILIISFSSCLGPKKINKWTEKKYAGRVNEPVRKKSDFITITSALAPMGEQACNTEKKTSHLLPLLFYWQWDYKNTCTLNPKIPVNNFTSTVLSYSNSKLKQKLNGQTIQLSIDQIPNAYAIDDKGHLIWLIYAFGWDLITVQPEASNLVVSYKVLDTNGAETKKGTIRIADSNKTFALKEFQSLKKKTWKYLDQYDASITTMSKQFVDQLLTQL